MIGFRARQIFMAVIVLGLMAGCTAEKHKRDFSFVFMTDIHVEPERHAEEGLSQAIRKVNDLDPDFVVTGGDLVFDALGQNYGRADSLFAIYNKLSKDFRMPVYNTIGNHEIFGLYEKSGVSPDHPEYGRKMALNRLNLDKTYRSFDRDGWHFMLLDGIGFTPDRHYYGHIDSLQMTWIREDLKTVDAATPIAVSTHIPVMSLMAQADKGGLASLSSYDALDNGAELMNLFEGHNLRLVLQGHLHVVEEMVWKNTTFITGGAVSASWWRGPNDGFPEGFVVINADRDGQFDWHYESYGWDAKAK